MPTIKSTDNKGHLKFGSLRANSLLEWLVRYGL